MTEENETRQAGDRAGGGNEMASGEIESDLSKRSEHPCVMCGSMPRLSKAEYIAFDRRCRRCFHRGKAWERKEAANTVTQNAELGSYAVVVWRGAVAENCRILGTRFTTRAAAVEHAEKLRGSPSEWGGHDGIYEIVKLVAICDAGGLKEVA